MSGPRRIWLCADDYGISAGVNTAIRDLIERGRLNATSVMTVGDAIGADEIGALKETAAASPRCAIGLHVTLTAPFRPLTAHFRPIQDGRLLPLGQFIQLAMLRQLDRDAIRDEVLAQIEAFSALFSRAPDYIDGHQHVQLFPQVRDVVLDAAQTAAPQAWLRQCGRRLSHRALLSSPKALLLDGLSVAFRKRAGQRSIACNTAFAGAYDFTRKADFAALMRQFIDEIPDGGLVMCHPGFVDDALRALDPLTDQREREYAYLAGHAFARLLAENRVSLA